MCEKQDIKITPYFDKETTYVLKGIALIMMFLHHFFTYPSWWREGIDYPLLRKLSVYLCMPLKMCVPIFCFITGYCYFFAKKKTYKYSIKKICDLLVSYWIVFFIFALMAYKFLNHNYTKRAFVKEGLALQTPTMLFCWYVCFYIITMLLLPVIVKILGKNIHFDLFVALAVIPLLIRYIEKFIGHAIIIENLEYLNNWLPVVLIGYIFASHNFLYRLKEKNFLYTKYKWINVFLDVLLMVAIPTVKYFEPTFTIAFNRLPYITINFEVIYAPFFIYAVANLFKEIEIKYIRLLIIQIGKQSLLMWFLSCGFFGVCAPLLQPILYLPRNPLLVTIWGLFICYVPALILDYIVKKINRMNKISC